MENLSVLVIVSTILLAGGAIFYLALLIARLSMKKQVHPSIMFEGFRQKMWMTAGLGIVFFCSYLGISATAFYFKDPQARLHLFTFAYENPAALIYIGLLIFACFSVCIYLVRIIIKYFYNNNKKPY